MTLNIPKSHHQGFKYLISFKEAERKKIINELKAAPAGLTPKELSKGVAERLKIDNEKIDEALKVLFGLYSAKEYSELDLEPFVEGIIDALKRTDIVELKPDKKFSDFLIQLMSFENSIYITSKTLDLLYERENILRKTRIITDIRPVFSDKSELKINSSVIIHTIKVEYNKSDEIKEIYFALDNDDLKKLKGQIIRAETKEKAIRNQYKTKRIKIIDIK